MTDTRTPSSHSPNTVPRLERLDDDRIIAGVASGIARRYDIGVGWVRLGFIVGFFFGFGLLAYLLGWVLIPRQGEQEAIVTRYLGKLEGASSWVGVGLIGLAVLITLGATDIVDGELVWAGALILVGVLLYRGDLDSSNRQPRTEPELLPPPSPADTPPSPPSADDGGEEPVGTAAPFVPDEGGLGELPPPPPTALELPPPPPAPPRPAPSLLGRLTVAVILIVVGVVWVLDRAAVLFPGPEHYAAIVLAVIGLGLLVGTWFGRARGLIGLGVIVLPFFLFFSYVTVPWGEGFGERTFTPAVVSDQPLRYELAGGQMIIDLTELDFGTRTEVGVEADLGFGELRVIVPREVTLVATSDVVGGQINLLGSTVSGFTIDKSVSSGDYENVLVLDLHVGFGELTVRRGS